MENFPLSMRDLNISSKDFKIETPQTFNMRILIMSKAMGFIRIKIFNDFCNITFIKRDSWKNVVICSFKGIGRKFASIFN